MEISIAKSTAIWFFAHDCYTPYLEVEEEEIRFTDHVRYLGIYIDQKLKFDVHATKLIANLEQRINLIKMVAGNKWGGHPTTLLKVLQATVRSVIDYGSSINGSTRKSLLDKVEAVYNRGLRICMRSLRTTPINALQAEAGSMPLSIRRELITRKEILKSILIDLPRFFNERWTEQDDRNSKYSFIENVAYQMREIIDEVEFEISLQSKDQRI